VKTSARESNSDCRSTIQTASRNRANRCRAHTDHGNESAEFRRGSRPPDNYCHNAHSPLPKTLKHWKPTAMDYTVEIEIDATTLPPL